MQQRQPAIVQPAEPHLRHAPRRHIVGVLDAELGRNHQRGRARHHVHHLFARRDDAADGVDGEPGDGPSHRRADFQPHPLVVRGAIFGLQLGQGEGYLAKLGRCLLAIAAVGLELLQSSFAGGRSRLGDVRGIGTALPGQVGLGPLQLAQPRDRHKALLRDRAQRFQLLVDQPLLLG